MYEDETLVTRRSPTIAEMLDWLEKNPDIVQSVSNATKYSHVFYGLRTVAAAIHYVTRNGLPGEADAFFTALRDGTGLEEGEAIHTLRRWLERASYGTKKPLPLVTQAVCVKAWNAFIEGRPMTHVRFTPGGSKPEAFPEIVANYV